MGTPSTPTPLSASKTPTPSPSPNAFWSNPTRRSRYLPSSISLKDYRYLFDAYSYSQLSLNDFLSRALNVTPTHPDHPGLSKRLRLDLLERACDMGFERPPSYERTLQVSHTDSKPLPTFDPDYLAKCHLTLGGNPHSPPDMETDPILSALLPSIANADTYSPTPSISLTAEEIAALSPQDLIKKWRQQQAESDYRSNELLRRILLRKILRSQHTDFKDLRAAASALLDIQRAQRLALGLSTDNVGMRIEGEDENGNLTPQIQVLIHDAKQAAQQIIDAQVQEEQPPKPLTKDEQTVAQEDF